MEKEFHHFNTQSDPAAPSNATNTSMLQRGPREEPSYRSFQSSAYGAPVVFDIPGTSGGDNHTAEQAGSVGEEIPWGPEHPCYPHMNPHVSMANPEYLDTRIIRIQRDWMIRGDLAPTFSNLYPEILDPVLPEPEFRKIITYLNTELIEIYDPFKTRHWVDGILGFLTGWLWDDIGYTAVKRRLMTLEAWIEAWNRDIGAQHGVKIWPLRSTGYMSLDIQVPDPKLALVPEGASQHSLIRPASRQGSIPRPMTHTTTDTTEVY
ncbi:Golgin subfamily A member 7/ERF4 [Ascosphaera apis ARSEF 7405]|uniref:Ras modification protein ERF4 n=1 Tax=Ascosphaera apis ARSEF 7405 TaxID=392613 RepID=A0A168CTK9_9EURO|nr:Golgin subfamily A member 7/ERF4 [Ascosphaera apis ARSEF 7405]